MRRKLCVKYIITVLLLFVLLLQGSQFFSVITAASKKSKEIIYNHHMLGGRLIQQSQDQRDSEHEFASPERESDILEDDYGLSFIRLMLKQFRNSNVTEGLSVEVKVNCTQDKERVIAGGSDVCVDKGKILEEMAVFGIDFEAMTLSDLEVVLVKVVCNILQVSLSGAKVLVGGEDVDANRYPESAAARNYYTTKCTLEAGEAEGHLHDDAIYNGEGGGQWTGIKSKANYPRRRIQPGSSQNPSKKFKDIHRSRFKSSSLQERERTLSLFQLLGYQKLEYYNLQERGFATNFSFSAHRARYIEEVANGHVNSSSKSVLTSLNPDLLERGRYQRYSTDTFCGQNKISKSLPSHADELKSLFRHLLYDDSKRIVFCYVPKNSCSNMKRMMLILNGLLPHNASQSTSKRPPEKLLNSVSYTRQSTSVKTITTEAKKVVYSFIHLTRNEALHKLQNYFKFAIIRNPLERLLSAYRNKLEKPLDFDLLLGRQFPDWIKAFILNQYDKNRLVHWTKAMKATKAIQDIHPSFTHFLKFITRFQLGSHNEHFRPFLQLCFPCAVDYDLILNFKTINYDIYAAMDYLRIPQEYYPPAVSHANTPTSSYMRDYFKRVPNQVISDLYQVFSRELEFYYSLHPEESGMHRHLLTP